MSRGGGGETAAGTGAAGLVVFGGGAGRRTGHTGSSTWKRGSVQGRRMLSQQERRGALSEGMQCQQGCYTAQRGPGPGAAVAVAAGVEGGGLAYRCSAGWQASGTMDGLSWRRLGCRGPGHDAQMRRRRRQWARGSRGLLRCHFVGSGRRSALHWRRLHGGKVAEPLSGSAMAAGGTATRVWAGGRDNGVCHRRKAQGHARPWCASCPCRSTPSQRQGSGGSRGRERRCLGSGQQQGQ